uniref:Imaginal disc growth factor n=1 Tax=Bemisia tabaci TaxID=7038 RepID=A0A8K1P8E9_BEMTA|nr:imaginal disc growth factor [Bemisia tabaci]
MNTTQIKLVIFMTIFLRNYVESRASQPSRQDINEKSMKVEKRETPGTKHLLSRLEKSGIFVQPLQERLTRSEPKFRDFMDELSSHGILKNNLVDSDLASLTTEIVNKEIGEEDQRKKIVCYYDRTKSYSGNGFELNMMDLNVSMSLCTHLVYGYAMVDRQTGKISLNHAGMLQLVEIQHIQMIHALKSFYPKFKLLLGIGAPPSEHYQHESYVQFNNVLRSEETRLRFINSVVPVLQRYNFDGIDLIWKFERYLEADDEHPKDCGMWCKLLGDKTQPDSSKQTNRYIELRNSFSDLVQEMKSVLFNYTMAVSILPQMDEIFYDKRVINYYADQIHLLAFDFILPWNDLGVAEHTAPIYKLDSLVNDWLWHDAQKGKIIVGVATYARTWRISSKSLFNTSPPVIADGTGPRGAYSKKDGIFSFYEVCVQLVEDGFTQSILVLNKVNESQKYSGTYAYRLPTNLSEGLWVSFDDPESAATKAKYVKEKGLSGMIVHGLVFDDFKGMCRNRYDTSYPILQSIANNLV